MKMEEKNFTSKEKKSMFKISLLSPSSGRSASLQARTHVFRRLTLICSCSGRFSPSSGVGTPPRAAGKTETSHQGVNGSRTQKSPVGSSTDSPGALLLQVSVSERGPSWHPRDGPLTAERSCLCRVPPRPSGSRTGSRRREPGSGTGTETRRMPKSRSAPHLESEGNYNILAAGHIDRSMNKMGVL